MSLEKAREAARLKKAKLGIRMASDSVVQEVAPAAVAPDDHAEDSLE
jgi:hypothetical protein